MVSRPRWFDVLSTPKDGLLKRNGYNQKPTLKAGFSISTTTDIQSHFSTDGSLILS